LEIGSLYSFELLPFFKRIGARKGERELSIANYYLSPLYVKYIEDEKGYFLPLYLSNNEFKARK
jgi:hypothetical protein